MPPVCAGSGGSAALPGPRRPDPTVAARQATEVCPHCGARFKRGRLACPECGSDASTGWKSQAEIDYDSVDLPELDPRPARAGPIPPKVMFVATLVLLFALLAFFGLLWVF